MKVTPLTRQAVQVEETETDKSFGIAHFKVGGGWCDRLTCREGLSLKHLSKASSRSSREAAKLPTICVCDSVAVHNC
jgi:hypothetical protein